MLAGALSLRLVAPAVLAENDVLVSVHDLDAHGRDWFAEWLAARRARATGW